MNIAPAETVLLSARDIAKRTGHAAPSIYAAIERYSIKPAAVTPSGGKLYSESVVRLLEDRMRKPRHQSEDEK